MGIFGGLGVFDVLRRRGASLAVTTASTMKSTPITCRLNVPAVATGQVMDEAMAGIHLADRSGVLPASVVWNPATTPRNTSGERPFGEREMASAKDSGAFRILPVSASLVPLRQRGRHFEARTGVAGILWAHAMR